MAQEVKLNMVISALDKFSAPFRKLQNNLDKVDEKFAALSKSNLAQRLKNVSSKMGDVGSKAGELASKFSGFLGISAALGGGLIALTIQVADTAKEIDRLASFAGVSSSKMQELMYAGKLMGVESEELAMQMGTLGEHIFEVANGNEELAGIFDALGISVKDSNGNLRKTDAVLLDLADAFSKMEDGPTKSAIGIRLFGDASSKLMPILNKGSAEISSMGQEAKDLGLILTNDGIQSSQEFSSSLARIIEKVKALTMMLGSALMPSITMLINTFSTWITQNKDLIAIKISDWVQAFSNSLPDVIAGIQDFFTGIGNLISYFSSFIELIGGAQNFIILLATAMAGPLLLAIAGAIKGFIALGVAMFANPIGLIIAGIAAVVAGFVLLVKWVASFSEKFRNMLPDWLLDLLGVEKKELNIDTKINIDDSELAEFEKLQADLNKPKKPPSGSPTDFPTGSPTDFNPNDYSSNFSALPIDSIITDKNTHSSKQVTETKIVENKIRLILPPGFKASGHEDSKEVTVETSSLGYQNDFG